MGEGSGRLRMTGEPGAEWSVTLPSDHSVDSLAGWALWQSGFKYQSVRIWTSPSNLPPIHSAAGWGWGVCLRLAVGRSKNLQQLPPSLPLDF